MSHYHHLSISERESIWESLLKGKSLRQIAAELKRNVSTISREIKRNCSGQGYRPSQAQESYAHRRLRCRQRLMLAEGELRDTVVKLIAGEQWSPEQIAHRLALERGGPVVSYATIYRALRCGCMEPKGMRKKNRYGRYSMQKHLRRKGWRGKWKKTKPLAHIHQTIGKKYLYDVVGIKENTTSANDLLDRETRLATQKAAQRGSASNVNVAQEGTTVNQKSSKKGRAQLDEYISKYGAIPKGETLDFDIRMPDHSSEDERNFFYDYNTQLEGPAQLDAEAFLYGLLEPESKTDYAEQRRHSEWLRAIGAQDTELNRVEKYKEARYNNSPEYLLLMQYVKDAEAGWISALSGFKNYKELYQRIQNEIVGKTTANGIVIAGQVPHFMQRVVGTGADPEKMAKDLRIIRRSGVEVDDIKDAVFSPNSVGEVLVRKSGQRSIKLIGEKCVVTVNPDTGMLIQTNQLGG